MLVSGTTELDRYAGRADGVLTKPFELDDLIAAARRHAGGYGLGRMTVGHRPHARRVREPPRALPLRALRGVARRAGGREGDLRAGARSSAATPTSSAASSSTRCARPRTARPATSASGCTGCARRARAGSSPHALVEREDELENRLLAARITFQGEEMPLRTAQAQLAVLAAYADREELGEIQAEASAAFNPDRLELIAAGEELAAELSGIAGAVERNEEEKGISLRELSGVLEREPRRLRRRVRRAPRRAGSSACSGPSATEIPSSYHTSYMRRLSPLEATYTKERATEVCLATLTELGFDLAAATNIKLDLDDRPQKAPRACVIASDPPSVVHLITRAQGGLHDYQAFLHEAGHALHYGGVDPSLPIDVPPPLARPRADRDLLVHRRGDLARARAGTRGTSASPTSRRPRTPRRRVFLEALLFRRYEAKLRYELGFWSRFPDDGGTPEGYEEFLTDATGIRYRSRRLPLRHGRGLLLGRLPARLDPLGAAPQLPDRDGRRGLVAQPGDRRAPARALPRGHEALERGDRARGSASTRSTRRRCCTRSARRAVRYTAALLTRPIRLVA